MAADRPALVADRPDVLIYVTPPLTEPLRISGAPLVNLVASTSGTDSDWVVKLIDVYPDEVPSQPELGGYQLAVAMDIFRGRYRESFETPKAITPNTPLPYKFKLPTVNHVFLPGHRVMVQVQSTWFPLYDRNPQTFVPNIFFAKPDDYVKATQRIYRAPGAASFIDLPIVPANHRAPSPQETPPISFLMGGTSANRTIADTQHHASHGAKERRQGHRDEEAGRPARELVADRVRQEPDPHHQPDDADGGELGDDAQSDRTQAELAELGQKVRADQPPWTHANALAALREPRRRARAAETPAPAKSSPSANFVGARRLRGPHGGPQPREQRREQDDEDRLNRLEPRGREAKPKSDRRV